MNSDRYSLFLILGGLFFLFALLLVMLSFVLVLPALAKEYDPPGPLSEQACKTRIRKELLRTPESEIRYLPASNDSPFPAWTVTGITGATRTFMWMKAEFDLVQVYFHWPVTSFDGNTRPVDGQEIGAAWIAYGVRTADRRYLSSGGSTPFAHSSGAQGIQPGKYQVSLRVSGPYVKPEGFDCSGWELDPFCQVEQSFLPGSSAVFVQSGFANQNPINGFLFWAVQVEKRLSLCEIVSHASR